MWTNVSLAFASRRDNWSRLFDISFENWRELGSLTLAQDDNCQVSPPYFPVETATLCTRIPSILPASPPLSKPTCSHLLLASCAMAPQVTLVGIVGTVGNLLQGIARTAWRLRIIRHSMRISTTRCAW